MPGEKGRSGREGRQRTQPGFVFPPPDPQARPTLVRARRALTMTPGRPPLDDAAVLHDGERILAVGGFRELASAHHGPVQDLGEACLVPGPINAHGHLELAHLAGRIQGGRGFLAWVEELLALPLYALDPAAVRAALEDMRALGVAACADVATRNAEAVAGLLRESGLFFVLFAEAIGTGPGEPPECGREENGLRSLAGHALYSTEPETLRRAKAATLAAGLPFSLHLAEHDHEVEILAAGSGPFWDLLRSRGLMSGFRPPGLSPVERAAELGLLDGRTLAVHCVKVTDRDIDVLAASRASVCLCPRSNERIGVGRAPWEKLCAAGLNLCLGTDSLASCPDLDIWAEARAFAQGFAGRLSAQDLAALLTRNPARALGIEADFGEIAPDRRAALALAPAWIDELRDA
jgi:cytosine/adenosine deaminase-related metal-dependent hydrolase